MICKYSNFLKITADPSNKKIVNKVQPDTTPSIVGIVFLKPKVNAECEVTMLFGPGEKPATMANSINGIICEGI